MKRIIFLLLALTLHHIEASEERYIYAWGLWYPPWNPYIDLPGPSSSSHSSNNSSILKNTLTQLQQEGNIYPENSTHANALLTQDYAMNDYWRALKNKRKYEKNKALIKILNLDFTPDGYLLQRRYMAGALYAGARPAEWMRHFDEPVAANDYELCKLYLQHGANPNEENSLAKTPLHSIKTRSLAELFANHGARIRSEMILDSVCHTDCEPALVEFYMQQKQCSENKKHIRALALYKLVEYNFKDPIRICEYENKIPGLLEKN